MLKSNIYYYSRSQQERAKKRLEFDNQCNRIYNQLDFEKQRDTESKYYSNILCKILYIMNLFILTLLHKEVFSSRTISVY